MIHAEQLLLTTVIRNHLFKSSYVGADDGAFYLPYIPPYAHQLWLRATFARCNYLTDYKLTAY